jgi:type I restriction enzyme S subunit
MSNFPLVRLGDVCESASITHPLTQHQIVLINTSDVLNGKVLNHTYIQNKNLRGQFKKSFQQDDILYSEIRPKNRRFAFVDFDAEDYVASTKLMVIRHNEKVLPEFLYYTLTNDKMLDYLQYQAETRSGTFPQITFSEMANLEIPLPPLPVQRAIAATLSCLDDAIENNRRLCRTLEETAEALFKELTTEDTEDIEGILSDIAEITMGQSPDGKSYNENGIGTVFYQGRADFNRWFPTERVYTTEPKRLAKAGDILLSVRAPVGDINIAYEDCCIGRGLAAIHSKYPLFVYCSLKSMPDTFSVFENQGTVFGCIGKNELNSLNVPIPSDNALNEFGNTTASMFAEMRKAEQETRTLTTIRDSLLPRLLSGEIEVEGEK